MAYVPGTAFYADGGDGDDGRSHLRLSFCYPPPERITEGVRRLAGVVDAELELLDTFGADALHGLGGESQIRSPAPDLA